jgi:hypothetical protein
MEQKTGGLSKGCLIGIIIASSLLFLLIVSGVTCYVYRNDLAKWAASFSVNGLKDEAARHPEIVDTTRFNAFVDTFVVRLKTDSLDRAAYANFMLALQPLPKWVEDHKLDSNEIKLISDAMIEYFPDLASLRPLAIDTTTRTTPADTSAPASVVDSAQTK